MLPIRTLIAPAKGFFGLPNDITNNNQTRSSVPMNHPDLYATASILITYALLSLGALILIWIFYWLVARALALFNAPLQSVAFRVLCIWPVVTALTMAGAAFGYFIAPGYTVKYTLSNGRSDLVFQGMAHIGSRDFYRHIDEQIRSYRDDGYVVFREGIGGSGQAQILVRSCELLESSNLLDVIEQPECLGGIYPEDIYADITHEQMTDFLDAKYPDLDGPHGEQNLQVKSDAIDSVYATSIERNDAVRIYRSKPGLVATSIATFFNRGRTSGGHNLDHADLFIDHRNEVIVDFINSAAGADVYIFYGSMHFDGVFRLLKQADPDWKIHSIEYVRLM